MMDFLRVLLTSPIALPWLMACIAVTVLWFISWLIAYFVAMMHAHAGASWRELLVTATRVKISWIWGWEIACFVLLVYLATLSYLGRIESWQAALPYLITALITVIIAFWLRQSVRKKVIRMQKLVHDQGGPL
jgi:hypothetical protein